MRQDLVAIDSPTSRNPLDRGQAQAGITWRHVATVALLMIVIPVLMLAGVAALVVVPLVLAVVGIEQARRLTVSLRQPVPARARR